MSCKCELNRQLKGLQARIKNAENDINAHYAGVSQLVLALAANPFTAASVAPSAIIYNLQPLGMKLLRQLLESLIPAELLKMMEMLTMINAASIEAAAGDIVDAAAAQAVGMVNAGIDSLSAAAMDTIFSTTAAIAALDTNFNLSINSLTTPISSLNYRSTYQTAFDSAFSAWSEAVNTNINNLTGPQISALNLAKLQAQRALAMVDAGIGSAFLDAKGALSGVYGTVAEVNSALHDVNGLLGFLTTQTDIKTCKTLSLQLGAR
jgi:hypothetical protein